MPGRISALAVSCAHTQAVLAYRVHIVGGPAVPLQRGFILVGVGDCRRKLHQRLVAAAGRRHGRRCFRDRRVLIEHGNLTGLGEQPARARVGRRGGQAVCAKLRQGQLPAVVSKRACGNIHSFARLFHAPQKGLSVEIRFAHCDRKLSIPVGGRRHGKREPQQRIHQNAVGMSLAGCGFARQHILALAVEGQHAACVGERTRTGFG